MYYSIFVVGMKGNVRTSRVSLSRGNGLSTDSGGGVGGIAGYRLRNKTASRGPGVSPVLRLCLLLLLISVLVWVAYMRTRKVTISSTTVVMENARIDTEEALTQRVPGELDPLMCLFYLMSIIWRRYFCIVLSNGHSSQFTN